MEKKVLYLNLTIALLSLGMIFFLVFLLRSREQDMDMAVNKLKPRSIGALDEEEATKMVDIYRNRLFYKKTQLVWHTSDELKKYSDMLAKYDATESTKPPSHYTWQVAFSPMFSKVAGKARLTFCLVPTLVSDDTEPRVFDFFTEKETGDAGSEIYKKYFSPLNEAVKKGEGVKSFIYDEGQLWP